VWNCIWIECSHSSSFFLQHGFHANLASALLTILQKLVSNVLKFIGMSRLSGVPRHFGQKKSKELQYGTIGVLITGRIDTMSAFWAEFNGPFW